MSTTTSKGTTNPFMTKRFMGSAVVVFAVILAALFLLLAHLFNGDDGTTAAPAPAQSAETGAGCGAPGSDQMDLTSAPKHTWRLVGSGEESISVPVFQDGPTKWDDGHPSCWAQSPAGAVSAAASFIALSSTGQEHLVYDKYTVPGPARDKGLDETTASGSVGTTGLDITGFRLVNYTKTDAEVEVLVSGVVDQEVRNMAASVTVKYQDGDWRYNPPTSLEPSTRTVTDTNGFTMLDKD